MFQFAKNNRFRWKMRGFSIFRLCDGAQMAEPTRIRKVCVIGAGAAGLCAARHFARDFNFEVSVYEQTGCVAGTWVYTEGTGLDENGLPIHSSMYRNLRTNLPARIMNFPDYPTMNAVEPCCVTHQQVRAYLENYAKHFALLEHIQFNTRVKSVRLDTSWPGGEDKWMVRIERLKTKQEEKIVYDAVMICNGHYFDPNMPNVPGIETFSGTVMHSHSYRKPEDFTGKTVFVLGAASSGIDIAIDLADHATRVYLSHNNNRLKSTLPANVSEVMGLARVDGLRFHLKDETAVTADTFIFCTGYKFTFPFLDETSGIRVDDNHVAPLYKHLINIDHPTMCIVGIPTIVIPFPMFHVQVQYFLALLKNKAGLPSRSVMLEDSKLKTGKKWHAHRLMDKQWEYNNSLADAGGFERLPWYYKRVFEKWASLRMMDLLRYKSAKLVICEDGESVELVIRQNDQ
nr:flavin-containing monooxygenase FMO GS-OX-like 2 isoform X1 [Megalopta genalis]